MFLSRQFLGSPKESYRCLYTVPIAPSFWLWQKFLQILLNVSWGLKLPLIENHWSRGWWWSLLFLLLLLNSNTKPSAPLKNESLLQGQTGAPPCPCEGGRDKPKRYKKKLVCLILAPSLRHSLGSEVGQWLKGRQCSAPCKLQRSNQQSA